MILVFCVLCRSSNRVKFCWSNLTKYCDSIDSYVSRVHVKDSAKHAILGVQQFKPAEFAQQINLNLDNAWGIMRCIIDLCMRQKEGKYLIMKDPNKV
jgi:Eukaryotic translation initiation factor 3 subunit 7 (eIF-3)